MLFGLRVVSDIFTVSISEIISITNYFLVQNLEFFGGKV
uniref:Uncharacterized protein n=1 Tax=Rhizophora mucronata TaxID=61149 RepID=A0A2P2Q1R7_RHIMU